MTQAELFVIPDELVQAARKGEPSALSELWERCAPIIHESIARSRRTRGIDPAEVAQEAALIMLSVLHDAPAESCAHREGELAPFADRYRRKLQFRVRTYLRTERRRFSRTVSTSETRVELELSRKTSLGTQTGSGRSLTGAIERLSPRQRAVVAGIYFQDESVDMVADGLSARQETSSRFDVPMVTPSVRSRG